MTFALLQEIPIALLAIITAQSIVDNEITGGLDQMP